MTIIVKNLTHIYMKGTAFEKKALDDINLKIKDGEIVGIIGHTGSGKSTLIQHFNGLLKPSYGNVSIDSNQTNKINQVGIVFQQPEYQLFEDNVYNDIAYGLKKKDTPIEIIDKKINEIMKIVGLSNDVLNKSPFELSGGQKKRVAMAGILILEPKILVLDEPAAGLDPQGREDIYRLIQNLHKEKKITIILVSHSMEDIVTLVDRLIVMNDGKIEMDGTIKQVFENLNRLENIGLKAPQIRYFMRELKKLIPNLNENIFTVKEAKEEIRKFL
ncbi:UNVERIFIED_CONTAM: energy-coupling factor transport system ATP-binding protein [Acetivibrio alkalicellulosi]